MKKKILVFFTIIIALVFALTMLPSAAFADGEEGGGEMFVYPGAAGQITTVRIHAWNATGTPVLLWVFKFDGTWEELLAIGESSEGRDVLQYLVYGTLPTGDSGEDPFDESSEGLFMIDSDEWTKDVGLTLGAGHYFAVVVPIINEGEGDDGGINPENFLIKEFNVYNVAVAQKWVRGNLKMTCQSVWVNQEDNFEMIFWWPYANNNWVKIFDMKGNLVYSINMPYDNPHLEVSLPDGMYTVRTYHDLPEPLQEFIIGK